MRNLKMQMLKMFALLVAITGLFGCSKDAPSAVPNAPTVSNQPAALAPDKALPFTEEAAPDFDPKLTLVWPGTPEESRRRINAGQADETTIYSASLMQLQSGPVTIFSVSVYEFAEKDLRGNDPKELVTSHGTSGDEIELTRKQIEHGPNRLLGFDVTVKEEGGFRRRVNVLAGTRIYSVQVVTSKQERLNAEDVAKFFESFAITD